MPAPFNFSKVLQSYQSGVAIKQDKFDQVATALKALASSRTYAGVPADKAGREETKGKPINNATLMFIHENGAPEVNIPARPVVHPAIADIQKDLIAEQKAGAKAAFDGNLGAVDRMFHRMGFLAQKAMRKRITDGPFVPLSPRTIAARRAMGFMGTRPLNVTGKLRQALTYVIRKIK